MYILSLIIISVFILGVLFTLIGTVFSVLRTFDIVDWDSYNPKALLSLGGKFIITSAILGFILYSYYGELWIG